MNPMNPKNIPAPGPYEVVVVIDEEGKARGARGEKWVLIKNDDGAIASVYPAVNSEATARILAAGSELLKQLKLAVAVIEDNKDNLASIDLDEKQMLLGGMKLAIAQATGEPLPVAIGEAHSGQAHGPTEPPKPRSSRRMCTTPQPNSSWEHWRMNSCDAPALLPHPDGGTERPDRARPPVSHRPLSRRAIRPASPFHAHRQPPALRAARCR